ncbi:MAG TPA: GTPase HflX [Rhodospirillaceae bacterium]|nr:GTPase HflX [Rhodospirillaceae bacterium]
MKRATAKRRALTTIKVQAFIIHPVTPASKAGEVGRDISDIMEEAEGLAHAIDLDVVWTRVVNLSKIQAGYFFGKGVREEIAEKVKDLEPDIVIVNHTLSPVQQRNLEKEWNAKVIDRTGLILEIFGARAQTKEGRIQVDLAALQYQRSRLVRSWTHLERQRGGGGFLGGPGERQIELDRRQIDQRIIQLKKELEQVRRTRDLSRKNRDRVPFPVVALVGYTNAGKSTLFNHLTGAKVFAKDLLFATLDPTMRQMKLPGGQVAILSDTVGFISDLPTHLVEAFRSTLEQVLYAEVILHVIDASRHDYEQQRQDVIKILEDLGISYEENDHIIEVYNKIDRLSGVQKSDLGRRTMISAVSGEGVAALLGQVTDILNRGREVVRFILKSEDGRALSWLYDHAEVVARKDGAKGVDVKVRIAPANLGKFTESFGYKRKKG